MDLRFQSSPCASFTLGIAKLQIAQDMVDKPVWSLAQFGVLQYRFFNVVHLFSLAIPIIGIQANILQVGEARGLHFNKIIDSYEEPEESEAVQAQYDERHWIDNYPGTLECARWYKALLERLYGDVPTKYFEAYISLAVDGVARVWVTKRKNDRAFVEVKIGEENFQEAVEYLNKDGISFGTRGGKYLTFNLNVQQLKDSAKTHEWLASRLSLPNLKVRASSQSAGVLELIS